ncbi:MAG TPA: hypothetical protein VMV69_18920 [Pirellulales bacterium]|nr:hypothetical protein [Pirellulales bacterium]
MTQNDRERLRCPTCRAIQEWSPTCRRCKCDLGLLRLVADEYHASRSRCLTELARGRAWSAFDAARECMSLSPDLESQQLLAVCLLLGGDWPAALATARRALAEETASATVGDSYLSSNG